MTIRKTPLTKRLGAESQGIANNLAETSSQKKLPIHHDLQKYKTKLKKTTIHNMEQDSYIQRNINKTQNNHRRIVIR